MYYVFSGASLSLAARLQGIRWSMRFTWGLFGGPPQACWCVLAPISQPPGGYWLIYHVLSGMTLSAHCSHHTGVWRVRLPHCAVVRLALSRIWWAATANFTVCSAVQPWQATVSSAGLHPVMLACEAFPADHARSQ